MASFVPCVPCSAFCSVREAVGVVGSRVEWVAEAEWRGNTSPPNGGAHERGTESAVGALECSPVETV